VTPVEFQSSVPAQFLASLDAFGKPDAFRHKSDGNWLDISHADMYGRVRAAVAALRALRLARADRVAILSENRPEWAAIDLALLSLGVVDVPIYPTLTPANIEYLLRDADARVIFVSSKEHAATVRGLRSRLPLLEHVVAFDADAGGDGVETFDAFLARAAEPVDDRTYRALVAEIHPREWASIIYTSGTTGEPKGTILSHGNFMANIRQCLTVFDLRPSDTCLSFLPLSHVFERTAGFYCMMTAGTSIVYAESIERVPDNLREVRPTVVCSVPRVYEKMYARILDTVAKGSVLRKSIFHWSMAVGRAYVEQTAAGGANAATRLQRTVADALAFRTLRERVGGRLRFFISGGAPLSKEIAEFFRAAGIPILEGYGLTETSPVIAVNTQENWRIGSVGRPLPGVEVKIADDGEILARGDNVMQGYFRKPEQTDEALAGGWFHTGDIGHINGDGFLYITDRKKDLIATAGGKKVAPQPIEARIRRNKFVTEAVLVGNRRPFISMLIVPNFDRLDAWARAGGLDLSDRKRLTASPEVRALYQGIVDRANEELAQFEKIKNFTVLDRELTVAEGHLTPTLKVRRKIVEEAYRDDIDAMYQPSPGSTAR